MAGLMDDWRAWVWLAAGAIGLAAMELAATVADDPEVDTVAAYQGPRAIKVAVTTDHACALMADQTVACWGVLPFKRDEVSETPQRIPNISGATDVKLTSRGTRVVQGDQHTDWGVLYDGNKHCALVGDVVRCDGQTAVRGSTALANGSGFSCALRVDHTVWCWGDNSEGELGDGTTTNNHIPRRVEGLGDIVAIYTADSQMFAVSSTGQVRWWGAGTGWTMTTRPELVPELDHATSISLTADYGCAVVGTGEIKCWGHGRYGAVGHGGVLDIDRPTGILWQRATIESHGIPNGARVVSAAQLDATSCAVLDDGTLWCWGQRPGPTRKAWSRPHQIEGINDVVMVSAATSFVILRRDGGVLHWRDEPAPVPVDRGAQVLDLQQWGMRCWRAEDHVAQCCNLLVVPDCSPVLAHVVDIGNDDFVPAYAITEDGRRWFARGTATGISPNRGPAMAAAARRWRAMSCAGATTILASSGTAPRSTGRIPRASPGDYLG